MSVNALPHPITNSQTNDTKAPRTSIGYLIGRFLQSILPRTWFCWVSRGTIQLQSFLRPHKWSYWTKISDNIYLGAMPLKNRNHHQVIHDLGIKAILSVNRTYEFQKQFLAEPVQSTDWEARGISFRRISSPDLEPLKVAKLIEAVRHVVTQVHANNPTYIHCTGGRGRSASVAICSLIALDNNISLQESIRRVQQLRPQVMLSQAQINKLQKWYNTVIVKQNQASLYG